MKHNKHVLIKNQNKAKRGSQHKHIRQTEKHGFFHHEHHARMITDFKRRFWVSLILTIPILVLSPMLQEFLGFNKVLTIPGNRYLLLILSSFVFFYGGYPFFKGIINEIKTGLPGMMTLIAVAITISYLYSCAVVFGLKGKVFFWELVTLIDIMLLGHWIEMKSVSGASHALEELAKLLPSASHKILPDGRIVDVPLEELKPGDKVLVKPGEKIPADGIVVEGETSVNEAMLTGESKPVFKKEGSKVIGGSINGEGSIIIEIEKTGRDSFLSQVIDLVKQAQESKSKTQDLANRLAFYLTIIAISGGVITFSIWFILMEKDFAFALERAVTVMVITCPHALGLAVPLVIAVSTSLSARNGLLIRNRTAFEKARNIHVIIFDKTGTLTEGKFGITDIVPLSDMHEKEILTYASSVEAHSEHPIAKAIVEKVSENYDVEGFKSIPGKGVQGIINGRVVKVVSPGYLKENGMEIRDQKVTTLLLQGKTVVFLVIDNEVKGAIALADIVRPESKEAISKLKQMGIRCMMLTGDNRQVAQWVSEELDLDDYFAEVLPHEKAEKIKEVQKRGFIVAMVGDGVNDAPALAQANIGIAIGAGTDVAIETADIILIRSNPLDVVSIILLARNTYKKMVQNLIWATGYNAFAIPIAAGLLYKYGILLNPAMGAFLMSLSTVIVAINAKFLRLENKSK